MTESQESQLRATQALITYGDEQYAEGVQDGWQQALNKLTDLIYEHQDWTPNQLLVAMHTFKDKP